MIPYSEPVRRIEAIRPEPVSFVLARMPGEISEEENAAGRGMLPVIVVHKDGDMQPRPGFFRSAKQLKRDTSDILVCRIEELKRVHRRWSDPPETWDVIRLPPADLSGRSPCRGSPIHGIGAVDLIEVKTNERSRLPVDKVNIREKLALFHDRWSPRVVGELNGQHVKLVKFQGEFVWHRHDHEDELFLVVRGRFTMEFRDRQVPLEEGEFLIVPRGVEHRPVAEGEVHVMLFEPAGTLNTGDVRDADGR